MRSIIVIVAAILFLAACKSSQHETSNVETVNVYDVSGIYPNGDHFWNCFVPGQSKAISFATKREKAQGTGALWTINVIHETAFYYYKESAEGLKQRGFMDCSADNSNFQISCRSPKFKLTRTKKISVAEAKARATGYQSPEKSFPKAEDAFEGSAIADSLFMQVTCISSPYNSIVNP